jgi:hypothetical protein
MYGLCQYPTSLELVDAMIRGMRAYPIIPFMQGVCPVEVQENVHLVGGRWFSMNGFRTVSSWLSYILPTQKCHRLSTASIIITSRGSRNANIMMVRIVLGSNL